MRKRITAENSPGRRAYHLCFALARRLAIRPQTPDRARAAKGREQAWRPLDERGLAGSGGT